MRAFDILLVSPQTLAKPGEVSDDDAKAVYEKTKDTRFATPEKRNVQQIVFPTEAEAAEAEAKIKGGQNFADIVKARNLKDEDVNLGLVTKADIFDPAIADAAFALGEGGDQRRRQGQVRLPHPACDEDRLWQRKTVRRGRGGDQETDRRRSRRERRAGDPRQDRGRARLRKIARRKRRSPSAST